MTSFGQTHWFSTARRANRDAWLFIVSFAAANYIRFGEFWRMDEFVLPVGAGAMALTVSGYIMGLYSVEFRGGSRFIAHALLLGAAFSLAFIVATVVGYVDYGTRIGRGFMALGAGISVPILLVHHFFMFHKHRIAPQRVAFLAESPDEMIEYLRFRDVKPRGIEILGRIDVRGAAPGGDLLGRLKHVSKLIRQHKLDRIVFADARMEDEQARPHLRRLRYSGTPCTPLINLCEEFLQYVPLHLVTNEWLLHSEATPREFYFRKMKRIFDVITSLTLLVILSPFLLLGVMIVKIFSPNGPLFFTQERVGRFGKTFQILKLRSMHTDAEKDGPQWSSGAADRRVFPGGAFLRRYRIDEIPNS